MCIYVNTATEPEVAKKDIICIKVLNDALHSPYYSSFYYTLGEVKKMSRPRIDNSYRTTSGLYSYANNMEGKIAAACTKDSSIHYKFYYYLAVIPKGSKYYTNGIEYCSNQLKVIKKIPNTKHFKWKYFLYKYFKY